MQPLVRSLFRRNKKKHDDNPFVDQRFVAPCNRRRRLAETAGYYLTIATVLRNEGLYIREWLAFYKAIGIDHILIYDNESTDGFQASIRDHLDSGFVEIIPWPHFVENINFQHLGFAHAVSYMAGRTTWLALLDLDEFLFSTRSVRLADTLSDYEDLPALAVYWMNYGTSGHRAPPQGLVIENFTRRAADNGIAPIKNFKSIVQPERVKATLGAHRFLTDLDPVIAFNENRVPLTDEDRLQHPHTAEILRINHYFSRSWEEFETRPQDRWARYRERVIEERQAKLSLIEREEIEDVVITRIVPHMQPWLGEDGPAACSPLRVIAS
jgi:hypothetical protein